MQSAPDQRPAEIAPEAGNDRIGPAGGRHLAVDVAQRALAGPRLELGTLLAGLEHELARMEGFETGPMADADQRGARQLFRQQAHDVRLARLVERRRRRARRTSCACWRRSEEHTSELQSHLNLLCRL